MHRAVYKRSASQKLTARARLEKEQSDRRDIEIIDRNADRLNREAIDTLEYQEFWRSELIVARQSPSRKTAP